MRKEIIKEFKKLLEENIRNIDSIVQVAEEAGLTNEQFYIDWEDYLNKVSIKEHPLCRGYKQD